MNNIFVRSDNNYSNTTFNLILPYIKHTQYHNSIFSGQKKWNENIINLCIKIHAFKKKTS